MAAGKKRSKSKGDKKASAPRAGRSGGRNAAEEKSDRVIREFLASVERLTKLEPADAHTEGLLDAARLITERLRRREAEVAQILRITERVNYGVRLDETLDFVYDEMREVIPYDRIGFSLIDEERGTVVARWARSEREMKLGAGYEAPLEGSTLKDILETGEPRILDDLEDYLRKKPTSDSTRLIVEEGMRSSLTCPLVVQGKPVGFMFFSSVQEDAYSDAHVAFFQQIAGQLSAIVEKGRIYTELAEQKEVIERQNRLMTRDLEMARQVQRALIPTEAPEVPGLEIAHRYEPAIEVGGDLLDILPLDDRRVVLFVADVMGHGVQAALVVSVIKAALHSAVDADCRPPVVLTALNRALLNLLGFHFVTAACCLVDRETRAAEIALAGHPPPFHFLPATGEIIAEGEGGLPLGIRRNSEYDSARIELAPGDVLLVYTDGVIEAMDPEGSQYTVGRLAEQVRTHSQGAVTLLLDAVVSDLKDHCAGRAPADDFALVALKATP